MKLQVLLGLALLSCTIAGAQSAVDQTCATRKAKQPNPVTAAYGVATPEENDYDVHHLKFNINLTNTAGTVSGDVTTKAKVTAASMPVYAFELVNALIIDSVKVNNQLLSVSTAGNVRRVTLPSALPQGAMFSAQVFYHGTPPTSTGQFFTQGMFHVTVASGKHLMYTMSDANHADDWWPSKQSLQDKIDSVDMWITVDDSLKAGSNGLLKNVTAMPGNKKRFEWKSVYPIDYYLICAAVAQYSDYSKYMRYTDGTNDSMLIQNFIYDSVSTITPAITANLDSTGYLVDYFSTLFGRYPFYKEKYGHCFSTIGGGMEHQTMTTMSTGAFYDVQLISHELGHQWWGDCVTYGSWKDIWLSEGLATYCEQLYIERFRGNAAALARRNYVFNSVMGKPGGVLYVRDTTTTDSIFDTRLTYHKGAAVAHMLRQMAPADSLFFKALRQYRQQFAYSHAFTSDLQNVFEQVYNKDLDTFFNQWVYKEGYPLYTGKWYQVGTVAHIQLNQTTSMPSSVAQFYTPLEIKIKSTAGDTIVKVYNNLLSQNYMFNWSALATGTFTGFQIDPDNNVLDKTITFDIKQDISVLHAQDVFLQQVEVYPNPATDKWMVKNVPTGARLLVTDATGRNIWSAQAEGDLDIPASSLAAGYYILSISTEGQPSLHYRLVKQ